MSFQILLEAFNPVRLAFVTYFAFLLSTVLTVVLLYRPNTSLPMRSRVLRYIGVMLLHVGLSLLLIVPFGTLYQTFFRHAFTAKATCYTITLLMTAAFVLVHNRGRLRSSAAMAGVFVFFNLSAFFVSNVIFDRTLFYFFPEVEQRELFHYIDMLTITFYILTLVPLMIFLRRFSTDESSKAPAVCWLTSLFLCIPGCIVYIILYKNFAWNHDMQPMMILVILALQFGELVSYYLSYLIATSYDRQLEDNAIGLKTTENFTNMQRYSQLNESMRELKHDLKNHISLMRTLLAQKDYENLDIYFDELCGTKFNVVNLVNSNNVVINSVLNNFIAESDLDGVKLETHVSIRRNLNIGDTDLCSLLSNLMNNAFEAARQSAEPQISVVIREENDFLFISVKNSINESVLFSNPDLVTSKEDKSIHGIGVKAIRKIAKKYNGSAVFSEEDGMFVANVMLVLKKTPARLVNRRAL